MSSYDCKVAVSAFVSLDSLSVSFECNLSSVRCNIISVFLKWTFDYGSPALVFNCDLLVVEIVITCSRI